MLEEQEQERRFKAVYDRIGRHVGCAVVFPSSNAPPEAAMNGPKGTVSFVDTGRRQFALTCDHVWQDFQDIRATNANAELVVFGTSGHDSFFMSDAHVIATGAEHLDLITLDVPDLSERLAWSGKSFYEAARWPPPLPEVNDAVISVGYPGAHQHPDSDDSRSAVQLRPAVFVLTVSSVSNRHAVLAENTDNDPRRLVQSDPGLEVTTSLGGISGSAVFVYDNNDVRLAGVVYEASPNGHESVLYVAHASYVLADGTLDLVKLPPF